MPGPIPYSPGMCLLQLALLGPLDQQEKTKVVVQWSSTCFAWKWSKVQFLTFPSRTGKDLSLDSWRGSALLCQQDWAEMDLTVRKLSEFHFTERFRHSPCANVPGQSVYLWLCRLRNVVPSHDSGVCSWELRVKLNTEKHGCLNISPLAKIKGLVEQRRETIFGKVAKLWQVCLANSAVSHATGLWDQMIDSRVVPSACQNPLYG